MKLHDLVEVSSTVAATRSRNAKRDALAEAVGAMAPDEREIGVAYLSGALPQGRIGVGPATLHDSVKAPAGTPTLVLKQVHEALERIRTATGSGSAAACGAGPASAPSG